MIRLALCALLLPAPVALAGGIELPTGFDGVYAPEGVTCADAATITVDSGEMIGMDGGMTVIELIEFPGEPAKVEAMLELSGGGGTWTESAVIRLDSDGQVPVLVFDYADGTRNVWTRCD